MPRTSSPTAHTAKQVALLRKQALSYPETREDFPWGHSAFKVKGKAFAFLHADADGFSISVKLPDSNALALHLPFAEPTGYGLGKSGWVTARFASGESAPTPVLSSWLEESFTAIAPKRMVAAFLGAPSSARAPAVTRGLRPRSTAKGAPVKPKAKAKSKAASEAPARKKSAPAKQPQQAKKKKVPARTAK